MGASAEPEMGEVLTEKLRQGVTDSWATFPWWSARRMWQHLRSRGSGITLPQVKQIGRESGWTLLRQRKVYLISADAFRPREEWLVKELGGLTDEQQITLADLEALGQELDLPTAPARRALPWVLRVERLLLGRWEEVKDERVRCIYCGTTDVSRKSRKGRWKHYVDEQGEERDVEVYPYYCHNTACSRCGSMLERPMEGTTLRPIQRWTAW